MGRAGEKSVDLFFCSCPLSSTRKEIADTTMTRWKALPFPSTFHLVTPEFIDCKREDFNLMRRVYADLAARTPIYILTDDDILPVDMNSIPEAVAILEGNPEFCQLSYRPVEATFQRWTPEQYRPIYDVDVEEHVSVGGLRVCRKGVLQRWPKMTGPGYDREYADACRAIGWRVGYYQKLFATHLGEHKSDLWAKKALTSAVK